MTNKANRKKSVWRFLYSLLAYIVPIIVRFQLQLEVVGPAERIKGPAVVLINHESNVDWLVTAYVLRRTPARFVMGRYQFRNPVKGKLFSMLGAIPKEQFYPDMQTIRMVKNAVKKGDVIVLFPSGQSSYSGESTFIPFETAKLLKSLSAPVYHIHINGAHLAFPKWDMSKIRKNRIFASFKQLLTKEELLLAGTVEIYERVKDVLYFDEYAWQKEHKVSPLEIRSVEGLEYVLFLCPKCKAEFQMAAVKDVLSCEACGYSVQSDAYGLFVSGDGECIFDTPTEWYRWQFREVAKQVEEQRGFAAPAQFIKLAKGGKFLELYEGELSMAEGILEFRESNMERPLLRMDIKLQPMLFQHESNYGFVLLHESGIYRFKLVPKGAATKCTMLKELYYLGEKRDTALEEELRALYDKLFAGRAGQGENVIEFTPGKAGTI